MAPATLREIDDEAWPKLNPVAYHGPVGEFVDAVSPHTEADDVALAVQLLVAFGNAAGRSPHQKIGAARHGLNLYAALVGKTAKGRKGTAEAYVRAELREADPAWAENCVKGGVVSGEGIIFHQRDPGPVVAAKSKKKGDIAPLDKGVEDKRLQLVESEFATLLKAAERQQNTSSEVLRQAWDGQTLRTLAKNSPLSASNAHVSAIAHITLAELGRNLTSTQQANGFGNRWLWILVKRSKLIPLPTEPEPSLIEKIAVSLRRALEHARRGYQIDFDDDAREMWIAGYKELSAERPGLFGAVTGRAEAQVRRLAAVYATLDCESLIAPAHLRAARAIWDYADASAQQIFGDALGDPAADGILMALRQQENGLTRTEISQLFSRHLSGDAIAAALTTLFNSGLASFEDEKTTGRPSQRRKAIPQEKET